MARLASEAKGGFYPTPPDEMALICKRFRIEPEIQAPIIDPCAGEGEALKMLCDYLKEQGGNPVSYGVELEETRAEKCKAVLDHAVKCAYETVRASNKAFSVMWLNPPYAERDKERTEVTFLRDLTDPISGKLMVGGILGYCIPQYVLAPSAPILAARFDDINVYRFTDKNFPVYKQVVVFGIRRARARQGEEAKKIREWLKALSGAKDIPDLNASDGVFYQVSEGAKKIMFRGSATDPVEIAKDIPNSPVWEALDYVLLPYTRVAALKNPVLPLSKTHDAIAIAAGAVGGNMGGHYLVGRTRKVTDKKVIPEEEGIKIVETDRHVTVVRVYTPGGVFDLE
ncbi:MAG: SAM-dependent methyltransferase [Peptococcaceae bacterium]|nr:SAM-dependent methyltransferase [Peptococcaceae bacterium]